MDNMELARWEARDRAAAQQSLAGQPRGAAQIDYQVKAKANAYQRMGLEARPAAESEEPGPAFSSLRLALPLLIAFTCIFVWLAVQ